MARSIFHITHVDNLAGLLDVGSLESDARMTAKGGPAVPIGMAKLKGRRFEQEVECHSPFVVADFAPFYFCPRSVMLFVIHKANHPELAYRGGQKPILHLRFDLKPVLEWARDNEVKWANTHENATADYASFGNTIDHLRAVNWQSVDSNSWSDSAVKERKQAEFLVHEQVPLALLSEIGVHNMAIRDRVVDLLDGTRLTPDVNVRPDWYY